MGESVLRRMMGCFGGGGGGAPGRPNLISHPEEFDNAAWSKLNVATALADQALAPNGTMTADLIQLGALNPQGGNVVQQLADLGGGTSANKTVTVSVYLRSLAGTQNLALKNTQSAVADHFQDITVTATWARYLFTFTNSASSGNGNQNVGLTNHTDQSAVSVYAWGFKAELGPDASTYPP